MNLKNRIKLLIRKTDIPTPLPPYNINYQVWGNKTVAIPVALPKIIWLYWHDEIIDSPITNLCIERIKKLHPDMQITLLHWNSLRDFLPNFPKLDIDGYPLANISDLVRLMLLEKYGGFYLDASTLLIESLDWLYQLQQLNNSECVAYYTAANTVNPQFPMIETWCLGAIPNSKFIKDWLDEYRSSILSENPDTYYENNKEVPKQEAVLGYRYYKSYYACQLIIRRESNYKLTLVKADDDAFLYSLGIEKKWNDINLAEFLLVCKQEERMPKMIKIINTARKRLDDWIEKGYYRKDSYLGVALKEYRKGI